MKSPATKLFVQEHADRSFLQRQRTYLRHGLNGEAPVRNVLGDHEEPTTTTTPAIMNEPTTTTTQSTIIPAIVGRVRNRVPGWAKVGLGAAVAGPMTAAAVGLGYYLNNGDDSTTTINNPSPVVTQPVDSAPVQPAPIIDRPPAEPSPAPAGGDLLEWLEREGYNR